jgi:cytochrome oxidase Cu insertion factor (SCO1/SenC/PrrC family)
MRLAATATATALALALVLTGSAGAHDPAAHHEAPQVTGPADAYAFPLAAPGSYRLPPIRPAADATLLDETGAERALHDLFDGRITVLAFIYTRCGDVCPLASRGMADLQALAAHDADVAAELQLVTLSFDPAYDTPARMADYAASLRRSDPAAPTWLFLTAPDEAAIRPVVEAYRQPVARKADPDDAFGPFSHLLRVFLIDGGGVVRNIYSADFLDPRLVLNDVRTLRLERATPG